MFCFVVEEKNKKYKNKCFVPNPGGLLFVQVRSRWRCAPKAPHGESASGLLHEVGKRLLVGIQAREGGGLVD